MGLLHIVHVLLIFVEFLHDICDPTVLCPWQNVTFVIGGISVKHEISDTVAW